MNDLQMTTDGDLAILNHDIVTVNSIEQNIFIRLRWWYGEWMFGPEYGMKYYENVFVKNPNRTLIVSDIVNQIMGVDGVKSVENVSVDMDYKTRKAIIGYSVTTEIGERFDREVTVWSSME